MSSTICIPADQGVAARRLLGLGIAEIGHRTVPLELCDHPAVRGDDGGDPVLVGVQHVVPVLRVEGGRKVRRPDKIGEHHGELAPLGCLSCRRHQKSLVPG